MKHAFRAANSGSQSEQSMDMLNLAMNNKSSHSNFNGYASMGNVVRQGMGESSTSPSYARISSLDSDDNGAAAKPKKRSRSFAGSSQSQNMFKRGDGPTHSSRSSSSSRSSRSSSSSANWYPNEDRPAQFARTSASNRLQQQQYVDRDGSAGRKAVGLKSVDRRSYENTAVKYNETRPVAAPPSLMQPTQMADAQLESQQWNRKSRNAAYRDTFHDDGRHNDESQSAVYGTLTPISKTSKYAMQSNSSSSSTGSSKRSKRKVPAPSYSTPQQQYTLETPVRSAPGAPRMGFIEEEETTMSIRIADGRRTPTFGEKSPPQLQVQPRRSHKNYSRNDLPSSVEEFEGSSSSFDYGGTNGAEESSSGMYKSDTEDGRRRLTDSSEFNTDVDTASNYNTNEMQTFLPYADSDAESSQPPKAAFNATVIPCKPIATKYDGTINDDDGGGDSAKMKMRLMNKQPTTPPTAPSDTTTSGVALNATPSAPTAALTKITPPVLVRAAAPPAQSQWSSMLPVPPSAKEEDSAKWFAFLGGGSTTTTSGGTNGESNAKSMAMPKSAPSLAQVAAVAANLKVTAAPFEATETIEAVEAVETVEAMAAKAANSQAAAPAASLATPSKVSTPVSGREKAVQVQMDLAANNEAAPAFIGTEKKLVDMSTQTEPFRKPCTERNYGNGNALDGRTMEPI